MSALVAQRVRWCAGLGARLFAGAAPVAGPAAWQELQRDPAALSAVRWAAILGAADAVVDPSDLDPPDTAWAQACGGMPHGGDLRVAAAAGPRAPRWQGSHPPANDTRPGSIHGSLPEAAAAPRHAIAAAVLPARAPHGGMAPGGPPRRAGTDAPLHRAVLAPQPTGGSLHPADLPTAPGRDSVLHLQPGRGGALQGDAASGVAPPGDLAAFVPQATPPHPPAAPTRLVQGAAGLGGLLALVPRHKPPAHLAMAASDAVAAPRGAAVASGPVAALRAGDAPTASLAPLGQAAWRAPASADTAVAPDVDDLLDALVERLRVEYLRHYGSAG